ncbi:hypothetical protein HCN44_005180 [Aphidius gifuensis]|uniref:Odorant-binding protein n=1 Tax=Aphidius gifuensis TaxID=684658 RepID=A0A834XXW6_APHGI|nr:uncharacterized protein LOC122852361 [Aphidius gifuensis]KAF7992836.1 hypothetical protein HCN44_005180 [Aphidius gifuensis]
MAKISSCFQAVFLVFLLSTVFSKVESLSCYQCNDSIDDWGCQWGLKKISLEAYLKKCESDNENACYTFISEVNEKQMIERGCAPKESVFKACKDLLSMNEKQIKECSYCDSHDGCNYSSS